MTALVRWVVFLDHYPLRPPEVLAELEAATKADAERLAREQWPRRKLLVQSAASAQIRSVAKHPLPDEIKAPRDHYANRRPASRPPSAAKQRYFDFSQAKRATHAARRGHGEAMTTTHTPRTGR